MHSRRTYRTWGWAAGVVVLGAVVASVIGPLSLSQLLPSANEREPLLRPVALASIGASESIPASTGAQISDTTTSAALVRPVGMLIAGEHVFVVDSRAGVVKRYSRVGRLEATLGAGRLEVPLFIARDDRDGSLLVSDRRTRSIEIFEAGGAWRKRLQPPRGVGAWAPLALFCASNGLLAVTDVARTPNRLVLVAPDRESARVISGWDPDGSGPTTTQHLSYPDAVSVLADEVWVSDSNRQRLVVFGRDGAWRRTIELGGLPRGFAVLPRDIGTKVLGGGSGRAIAYADTTSHLIRVVDERGRSVMSIGSGDAVPLAFPTAVVADSEGRLYATDSGNGLVRVWGWEQSAASGASRRSPKLWWLIPPIVALAFAGLSLWAFTRPPLLLVTRAAESAVERGEADIPARVRLVHATSEEVDDVLRAAARVDMVVVTDTELRKTLAAAGNTVLLVEVGPSIDGPRPHGGVDSST